MLKDELFKYKLIKHTFIKHALCTLYLCALLSILIALGASVAHANSPCVDLIPVSSDSSTKNTSRVFIEEYP